MRGRFALSCLVILLSLALLVVAACSTNPTKTGGTDTGSNAAQNTENKSANTKQVTDNTKNKSQPETLKKVTLQIVSKAMTYAPDIITLEKGFFKDEGFDVEILLMKGPLAPPALVSGSLDYATVASATLDAALQGVPVRIIAITIEGEAWSILAQPNIKRLPDDLNGKLVGTSGIGSGDYFILADWLMSKRINPERDVTFVQVGGTSDRLAALLAKSIDVAPLLPPANWQAEEAGMQQLAGPTDLGKGYNSGLVVTSKSLKDNRDEVKRLLRAIIRGSQYLHDPINRDEVIKIMAEWLGQDHATARKAFEFTYPVWTKNGLPDLGDYEKYIKSRAAAVGVKQQPSVADVADFSLANEILSELGRISE